MQQQKSDIATNVTRHVEISALIYRCPSEDAL
jgi:hypothetical protein